MAVRELGNHEDTVLLRGKRWHVVPSSLGDAKGALAVRLEHRVDRNEKKIKRLDAIIAELRPAVEAAESKTQHAESWKEVAEYNVKDAWLFKGKERAELSHANTDLWSARREFKQLLERWNPAVKELNGLRTDPARWTVRATLEAWSLGGRLYQVTHVHPTPGEATILIEQFLAKRRQDLRLALAEVEARRAGVAAPGGEEDGAGYLYALSNQQVKGLKLGGTSRTAEERARELSSTGVPTPFIVVYCHPVSDWRTGERLVFARLAAHRISAKREFFDVEPRRAVDVIRAVAHELENLA